MALCQFVPKDENGKSTFRICLNRTTWLIGTFRNAIVLIVSSYMSYLYIRSTEHDVSSNSTPPIPFKVIGTYDATDRSLMLLTNVFMDCRQYSRRFTEFRFSTVQRYKKRYQNRFFRNGLQHGFWRYSVTVNSVTREYFHL